MKTFHYFLVFIFVNASAFSQNANNLTIATDFKKLEQGLLSLKDLMAKDSVSHTEAIPLELDIRSQVDNIYLDMNVRLPNGNGNLTPEWKEFTTQLAEVLEPHEKTILEAAYLPQVEKNRKRSQLNRLTFNADQLIGFLKPDREVELLMRDKLQQYPTLRWQIYRHLHELRFLRDTDVKEMEALGATITDPKEKIKWAEEVSFYGSDAGLDTLEKILSVPFDPSGSVNERGEPENNESFSSYVPAGRMIRFLGVKGDSLLPLIKDREKEVFKEYSKLFGDEFATRAINLFKVMQMSIRGEVNPYTSARNRSGLLYPPGQEPAKKPMNQVDAGKSNSNFSSRPEKRHDAASVEGSKIQNDAGRFINWLMGALALVIFGTLIILLFKRRNAKI